MPISGRSKGATWRAIDSIVPSPPTTIDDVGVRRRSAAGTDG